MRVEDIAEQRSVAEDVARIARVLESLSRPGRGELVLVGLTGALIGAGLALLFAPTPGSELRSKIGERIDDYVRAASEVAVNGHDRAEGA